MVRGTVIGTGVFALPSALAPYGPISLVAFILVTVGALALAVTLGKLSKRVPGSGYTEDHAKRLAAARGWSVAADGERWRRVVPSPRPRRIPELASIRGLLDAGTIVVCGGGGGIPVEGGQHGLAGVEAVVDKDLTAAHLAVELDADRLLVLTDVSAVMHGFGTPRAMPIRSLGLRELAELRLPAGSIGPKVQACDAFTTATGRPPAIGSLTDAAAILAGTAGTTVRTDRPAAIEQFGPVAAGSRLVV